MTLGHGKVVRFVEHADHVTPPALDGFDNSDLVGHITGELEGDLFRVSLGSLDYPWVQLHADQLEAVDGTHSPTADEPDVRQAVRLEVEDGDTIVYTADRRLTTEQLKRIREQLLEAWPNNPIVVLDGGAVLTVVGKPTTAVVVHPTQRTAMLEGGSRPSGTPQGDTPSVGF